MKPRFSGLNKPLFLYGVMVLVLSSCSDHRVTLELETKRNILKNPSFEDLKENAPPTGWTPRKWRGRSSIRSSKKARTGNVCVCISSKEGADASIQTIVPVKILSRYRLTGWIKTQDLKPGSGRGALLNIHNIKPLATKALTGTTDWTQMELIIDTKMNDVLAINCLFGGWGQSTGKAWFDDLSLELISSKEINPSVTIDATITNAPISKYIYGQFIEHLGKCIYGGIWAEMLEDRKFFLGIHHKDSPWKAFKNPANITMDEKIPYVGAHTPKIILPGQGLKEGIVQHNLGVLKDMTYSGRIILKGVKDAAPIEVTLDWGSGAETVTISELSTQFQKIPLHFQAKETTNKASLSVTSRGGGCFKVGAVSLMPDDNIKGWRRDTLNLMKQLNSPVYRWPGGNFVSGYNWKDGIGDPDKRPPRKNPAWTGVEHNDVGIHEFMDLCKELNTDPFITVNTGLGTKESAAQEVEYVNGALETPMGKLRARNGAPEPFKVKWWAVGNEMYGGWQLGHMPLKDYVKKHNSTAKAMRAKDPSIRLVGVGSVGNWSKTMLTSCADHMDLISEHFYCQEAPGLLSHVIQIPRNIRRIAHAHREYQKTIPALKGKKIPIALDEWNYWYGPYVYGELGTRYYLKDSLGIAAGLHEYFRNTDIIFMANYAQTVNVIGCIKTSKTQAEFATTGLALMLYRKHFGTQPIPVKGAMTPLDVAAAWTRDKKR